MDSLLHDLRASVRALPRNAKFTLLAVLYLALGIGSNLAIASLLLSVLGPLPYSDPERLVLILDRQTKVDGPEQDLWVSPWNYLTRKTRCELLSGMAALKPVSFDVHSSEAETVKGAAVSADFLPLLGVGVATGRLFSPEEDQPGGQRVVILGAGFKRRHFGETADVLGQNLVLNGESHTIIGILPADFHEPISRAELWTPLSLDAQNSSRAQRQNRELQTVARLKPGVDIAAARSELETIDQQLAQEFPDTHVGWGSRIYPLPSFLTNNIRDRLIAFPLAAGFVLLIALANLTNILLARAQQQGHELVLRTALGASRWRLTRQWLCEGLVIAGLAGLLGFFVAYLQLKTLPSLQALAQFPLRGHAVGFSLGVLAFAVVLIGLIGCFFCWVPSWYLIRNSRLLALNLGRNFSPGVRQRRFLSAVVVVEVALAVILLIGTNLMIKSLHNFNHTELGFDPENVLTLRFHLPKHRYPDGPQRTELVHRVLEQVRGLPGVESVGITSILPLSHDTALGTFTLEGRSPASPGDMFHARFGLVTPEYLQTLRIPLLQGRMLTPADDLQAPGVVLVSQRMAETFWPGENPIGKRMRRGQFPKPEDPWLTVVGVVGDVKYERVNMELGPAFYYPFFQQATAGPAEDLSLVVRGNADHLGPALRQAFAAVDPALVGSAPASLDDIRQRSPASPRIPALLLGTFSGLALLLAGLGLYGVIAEFVSQRLQDMGVRMALGAQASDLKRLVLGRGLLLVAIGLVLGWLGAGLFTRFLAGVFYGVNPAEPWVFLSASLVLSAVAFLACYLPARRAAAVDPIRLLRYE